MYRKKENTKINRKKRKYEGEIHKNKNAKRKILKKVQEIKERKRKRRRKRIKRKRRD